ncbi:unnamed protein product [Amoebophrya sp. A25]|nr:unnamed protein product [Amoebophrya sp. A25]|eukprot:GSA25T00016831001.1
MALEKNRHRLRRSHHHQTRKDFVFYLLPYFAGRSRRKRSSGSSGWLFF